MPKKEEKESKVYRVRFESTVMVDAYIKAPSRKAADTWGYEHGDDFIGGLEPSDFPTAVDEDGFEVTSVRAVNMFGMDVDYTVDKDGDETQ